MKDLLRSNKVRGLLSVVGTILLFLVVFGLGMAVGYRRALFASRWGERYYENFSHGPFNMHGVVGDVIDVASSGVAIKGLDGNEQAVLVGSDTVIRAMGAAIDLGGIVVGNSVTVIGRPNDAGQIEARFIRVFGTSSSMPFPPPSPGDRFN